MKFINFTILSISLFISSNAQAASSEEGNELHEESCVRCHSSDVYTRSNARVTNLPSLGKQVRFCKNNLGISWFNEDVDHVVTFLNKKYYKF